MTKKLKKFFDGKRVLILGFGREGKSTLKLIKNFDCEIAIADQSLEKNAEIEKYPVFSGENYLDPIKNYDIVMKSPGVVLLDKISPEEKEKITSQTDLLLRFCENKIIGVTGTKGKSTTSSLIEHLLKACGKNSALIGNIGVPPLEIIKELTDDMTIVCEMSCHQLEYVKASPDIAVLLNIYEEHLDHYVDFNAYKTAKENIFKFQSEKDVLIYGAEFFDEKIKNAKAKKISISQSTNADVYVKGNDIVFYGEKISYEKIAPKIEGKHNLYNIAAALAAVNEAGCDPDKAADNVKSFCGLEHRMEFVKIVNGVKYINDSISTIPLAAINAVKTFNADTLIIGGMDRGINYDTLINFLNDASVKIVICLPDSGYRIADMLDANSGKFSVFKVKNMEEAVKKAYETATHCCVLSPAAASYGFYKNFEERGKHFKELVNKL